MLNFRLTNVHNLPDGIFDTLCLIYRKQKSSLKDLKETHLKQSVSQVMYWPRAVRFISKYSVPMLTAHTQAGPGSTEVLG